MKDVKGGDNKSRNTCILECIKNILYEYYQGGR